MTTFPWQPFGSLAVVQAVGDYTASPWDYVAPQAGLTGYAVFLPDSTTCRGAQVSCARDPTPGSVCKVFTQGSDVFGNGNTPTADFVQDENVPGPGFGGRYAGLYVSDGAGTWWVIS